jgi:cytochrome c-type biogenesis protein CcmE
MVATFITGASPFVTVSQAKVLRGDSLHLPGDIVPGTLWAEPAQGRIRFQIRDDEGRVVTVLYEGMPPANMGEVTRVVAIGRMKGDVFYTRRLLVKCPSRYESDPEARRA